VLTTERRLGAGLVVRAGSRAGYRAVAEQPGEPHLLRTDLVPDAKPGDVAPHGAATACLGHITDLHVIDVQSPARFEFVNRQWGDPRFRELLTMQRPQEALNVHAIRAMLRTLNRIERAPVTGSPLQLVAMTGDSIDNTQLNELTNFLALMDGGMVRPDSGAPGYEGVQSADWPAEIFWKPDGPADGDIFQAALGYPSMPGLLDRAMQPFQAEGLRLPWLGCYGNHEEVCQGVGIVNPTLAKAMAGSRKPIALPDGFDFDAALETFVKSPEVFMTGPALEVSLDRSRRPISRPEFVAAHSSASPGFTGANREGGTAYYVHDTPRVRFITLDTVCPAGGADGRIDPEQLHWLERRLEEAHATFRSRDGSLVRSQHPDRLVVVLSHHGFDTLANPRAEVRNQELMDLLLRFRNVVLWLNGHIHANRITPRAGDGGHGLWEVTTSALVDWPCQARVVELFDAGAGLLGIACTMVDHDGEDLAGVHRQLAANAPDNGFDSWRPGGPGDRNVVLLLRAPF
jgi:metallophosphoesterase (TIGR03767 family)